MCTSSDSRPVDSSLIISKSSFENSASNGKGAKETEALFYLHPMQSVYLGSDRRYNRYWLFLGPCNVYDPGHKRVYFESSEDGHWEVIDTEEVILSVYFQCFFLADVNRVLSYNSFCFDLSYFRHCVPCYQFWMTGVDGRLFLSNPWKNVKLSSARLCQVIW